MESTATIGAASAIASLGTAVGGFLFGRLAKHGPAIDGAAGLRPLGVGLIGMGLASTLPLVVVFAVVTGFGNGLILPSLLTWALGPLTFEQRGRGTGVWTSAFFIGQFVCPLVVLALTGRSTAWASRSWCSESWRSRRRSASGVPARRRRPSPSSPPERPGGPSA